MPDLIIEPDFGDDIHECFAAAFQVMCKDKTMRTARFSHNGLEVMISRKRDETAK